MKRLRVLLFVLLLVPVSAMAAHPRKAPVAPQGVATLAPMDDAEAARMATRVKGEFLHAWQGYRQYAWGHDALLPLS